MSHEPGPYADPDEVERVARDAAAGDRAALEHLLGLIQPRVMRLCARMLPCREDAEEACQDTLLKVATKIGTFKGTSKFTTWLYVVAGNSARQTYRSLKRRSVERPVEEMPTAADPRTTSVIAGSRLDLLEALETMDVDDPDLVEAVVLRDISELDYQEISQVLDIPLGTVKSRIHKARRRLRPLLVASG